MELLRRNTDYALRALVHMAAFGGENTFRMGDLAKATGAPETFLRKVMQKLDAAGVVATKRGTKGGVSLGKAPALISVLEVVEAVQGPVAINKCFVSNRECADREGCTIRRNLGSIQDDMVSLFRTATVETLSANSIRSQ